jgi:hypothetical protein
MGNDAYALVEWLDARAFPLLPAQQIVGEFLQTFVEFPPRMKAARFTIDQVQAKLESVITAGH